MKHPVVYIALPIINEFENLPDFINSIIKQRYQNYKLIVCINQYESWWNDASKKAICINNALSIKYLNDLGNDKVVILDRSSQGKGWLPKKGGVGFARKVAMDFSVSKAQDNDLIVSMDADTFYPKNYLLDIVNIFRNKPFMYGLSLPYYHPLSDDKNISRLILRYEIYMRYYALNMIRIGNPYSFTALGSAIAFPVWAYKKVGGLTPVQSGEDFYFLQKLVKAGLIVYTADTVAYPSARLSSRVNFGTGPALIKGAAGNWDAYPFYHYRYFDEVKQTYLSFSKLFIKDYSLPMDSFLQKQFGSNNIWKPLRKNYTDVENFKKACMSKIDGLRILQYLRYRNSGNFVDNNIVLKDFFFKFYKSKLSSELTKLLITLDFKKSSVVYLNNLRDFMFRLEKEERLQNNN